MQPLIQAVVSAFGEAVATWFAMQSAKSEGYAIAQKQAAEAAAKTLLQFEAEPMPTREELLAALRKGEA